MIRIRVPKFLQKNITKEAFIQEANPSKKYQNKVQETREQQQDIPLRSTPLYAPIIGKDGALCRLRSSYKDTRYVIAEDYFYLYNLTQNLQC